MPSSFLAICVCVCVCVCVYVCLLLTSYNAFIWNMDSICAKSNRKNYPQSSSMVYLTNYFFFLRLHVLFRDLKVTLGTGWKFIHKRRFFSEPEPFRKERNYIRKGIYIIISCLLKIFQRFTISKKGIGMRSTSWAFSLPGSSLPGVFQAKKTGVGCHFLLQVIFATKESSLHHLHLQL